MAELHNLRVELLGSDYPLNLTKNRLKSLVIAQTFHQKTLPAPEKHFDLREGSTIAREATGNF